MPIALAGLLPAVRRFSSAPHRAALNGVFNEVDAHRAVGWIFSFFLRIMLHPLTSPEILYLLYLYLANIWYTVFKL